MANSICDDKLVQLVGYELSRIGLFTAISEIEQSAVLIYAKLRKAYVESNKKNFVLDSDVKTEKYYSFLSNAIIVKIFSDSRLKKVRNTFELNSALCLLDGYLHKLSDIAGTVQFKARDIFNNVILDLPIDMRTLEATPVSTPSKPDTADHHLDALRHGMYYGPPQPAPQECNEGSKLCNRCDIDSDECFDTVNMTVEYGGVCFGFRVDPELLGLDLPIEACDVEVFKNFIKKGAKEFNSKAKEIFQQLHEEYNHYA